MIKATFPTCNTLINPLGLGQEPPRFSWIIESDANNILQAGYNLQVARDAAFTEIIWDTGDVTSRDSVQVTYEGPALCARTRYHWRVKVRGNRGEESVWSEPATFETALWGDDWAGAKFISPEKEDDPDCFAGFFMRKEFTTRGGIKHARIYATAKGAYELHVNGSRVGDAHLTPGWTTYFDRLQVQTYDITNLMREGGNAVCAHIGPGWYKSGLAGWRGDRNCYGDRISLLARLVVTYADGTEQNIVTDGSWTYASGPVKYSEIYHGETYDARDERIGCSEPGYNAAGWESVMPVEADFSILTPQDGLFIRAQDRLAPIEKIITPKGETVIDFGQNMTGWVELRIKAQAGGRVVFTHAEVLDAEGNFYTANLRKARERIEYICKGGEEEIYHPRFTFQGFRYIRVEEFPGEVDPSCFTAVSVHSDMARIGRFNCSDSMVNQLFHNILWGMKSNFLDVPTDCPQRDERLGWTGDAQIFAATASTLMDTDVFFTKWLKDLEIDQAANGSVPHVVPDVLSRKTSGVGSFADKESGYAGGACGWADAAVIIPWALYLAYGDKAVLKRQYESMKAWHGFIRDNSQDGLLWNTGFHFGDWVALDAKEGSVIGATPNDLLATAYYANTTDILSMAASVLGYDDDAAKYRDLYGDIVKAYRDEFYTPTGRLVSNTQTAHAISLLFNLVAPEHRARTVAGLLRLIEENDGHLTTGFLGTPALCRSLSENGEIDAAYALLMRKDYPSWLYPITKGATTIWEHWDSIKPDGTMWSVSMNSFNHYAYGAIGMWFFTDISGINIDSGNPAYRHTVIAPRPGGGLTSASSEIDTPYGLLSSAWTIDDGKFTLTIKIPHNATATVKLPGEQGDGTHVGSGTHTFIKNILLGKDA